jgi:Replication-relaxation
MTIDTSFAITPAYDILLRGDENMQVGLTHLHMLTAKQLCRLHYSSGTWKAVRAKLKLLEKYGYVQHDNVPTKCTRSPYYYTLGKLGVQYLKEVGMDINESFRAGKEVDKHALFVQHTLELNDVIISAALLKRSSNYWLDTFIHERELKRTPYKAHWHGGNFTLIPDAYLYFRVNIGERQLYKAVLLEHDRGSEEQHYFRRRIQAYLVMLKNKGHTERFKVNSVVIAFTTSAGEQRLKKMREWTLKELEESGDKETLGPAFYFTSLTKPIEPRELWLEPCWYLPYEGQPLALLGGG